AKGKKAVIHDDGRITSAGDTILGADDLAGVTAILEGLQVIIENNLDSRPIEILFTVAEEIYCVGAAHIEYSRLQSKEAYVLDLTGAIGEAAYKAPTFLSFEIKVKGKASHAGFAPEMGINAIAVAAQSISSIKQGRIDEDTTVNIGTISGGLATNIVSDHCVVKGEVRSYSKEKATQQMELIQAAFEDTGVEYGAEITITTKTMVDAYETPLDHPVVKRFEDACEKQGLKSHLSGTFGGSDNNHLSVHGITGIVLASAMNECHSTKEFTTIEDLYQLSKLTLSLMTMDH
ncbi:MAG TPA: M20/M25/M40 family metallo-hydrolase, partial [Candidatus Merdenecus merdavium]|nr:M20/M25/M40 family metallo-hydrolase [Candidatus Merdenecus merdavium]